MKELMILRIKELSMKKQTGNNKKVANTTKPRPYTPKQEIDIVLGKIIEWIFLLSLPFIGFFGWGAFWDKKVILLVWGILCLLFTVYNLLGIFFKWDHSRVCCKDCLKKYKFDIRNDWNEEDTKDNVSVVIIWGILGVAFLICAIVVSFS